MVHRVYPAFLPFCKLYGFIYIMPVFRCCAALLVIGKTVCALCTFGGSFIDCVIRCGGCSLFRLWGLRCFAACACISFRLRLSFLFPVPGLFLREAPARLFLLWAVPVRWSAPYPVPVGFLQNARLWYQSDLRRCCGLFQESLLILQVPFRCSTRRYTQKNSPTYQARSVGKRHRRRFLPVPRGCGGRGVLACLCLCYECRVGDFMDCGLDILQFLHALVDDDTLFLIIATSFYAAA